MAKLQADAFEKQERSEKHLQTHEILARSVTMFQVAIAVSAISVLTGQRRFWFVGIAFGVIGLAFLVQGLIFDGHGAGGETAAPPGAGATK